MRNYSAKQAQRGRTAYRTPSVKRFQLTLRNQQQELRCKKNNFIPALTKSGIFRPAKKAVL